MALLVIPLTIYLVQQEQDTRSQAAPSSNLAFSPPSLEATVGGKAVFDIFLDPGTNQVNFIKLVIGFDSTKLGATNESFEIDPAFNIPAIQDPAVEGDQFSVTFNTSDPTAVLQEKTKIGTITFDVLNPSDSPSVVSFDETQTQIRALGTEDSARENMLVDGPPASVSILEETNATPTPSLSPSPTTSPEPTESPTPSPTVDSNNQIPVCEDLSADVATSGEAPYSINFTATGSDTDGEIAKVSFNFGEGSVEDDTTSDGIGTATISAQRSHTYENSGTFTASAVMYDNDGGVSDSGDCSSTVTITGGGTSAPTGSVTPLPDTGPAETIVGAGILGGILFIIGAFLFFAL